MKGINWLIEVLNNVRPDEFCSIEKVKELCLQAKEMEEQEIMYTEEDMRKAFSIGHKCARQGSYNAITEQEDFDKWKREGYPINFEQFKKK
jgi:hypothetical protein